MRDPQKVGTWALGSISGARSSPDGDFPSGVSSERSATPFKKALFSATPSSRALLFVSCLCATISSASSGLVLSDHIRHFEPVFFDPGHLRSQHHRAKRDVTQPVALDFSAHNREFKIRLKRDASIFADDVVLESTEGIIDFDLGKVYSGTLEDDDLVEVHGVVTKEGLFDGHIATPNELYYLEPADRYLDNADFHSVMYKASDVVHPQSARCASEQLRLRGKLHNPWVSTSTTRKNTQEGLYYEPFGVPVGPPRTPDHPNALQLPFASSTSSNKTVEGGHHRPLHPKLEAVKLSTNNQFNSNWEYQGQTPSSTHSDTIIRHRNGTNFFHLGRHRELFPEKLKQHHFRKKRSVIDPKKTTCMLYLQADHLFYREEGSEEACIDKITRHVQRVNNIYKVTDFDRDGKDDHIGFMIKRIKIHTEKAANDPGYRFPGNYGVEKFLELFSEEDYDAFCLAYMFTYRDFEGGTLGLAWTGDLKNAGGVCEKNGHYRGSLKSLNTGIVTLLNYGKKVPPAVSHVTLAHEIGHNFGSPHDPEKDMKCTPGGENGNFIMFARATSGDKRNNNRFSPCSLKQINNVLNSKARDAKGCFTEPQRAICGNGVVEDGEECDCGWQEDCEESCCYPMVANPSRHQKPCTLRAGKTCSPSQGPCCTKECGLKQGDLCREDNGCRDASFCDGRSPYCPSSINKPNKTICKDEFVCFKGECTGSICLAYGLDSCQCRREAGDLETKSCELCCKLPGENQPCLSSFDWNVPPYNIPDMYAKPGTPCDNYKGYCDVFQKCREVDPSGPLATLRKILLSNESLANLHRWIVDHWYAVLFFVIALIIILGAIMKLFGSQAVLLHSSRKTQKHGGNLKKKKKKTIVHKNGDFITTSVGATMEGPNLVIHPTVVRTNIPFKRKVNEVRRVATKARRAAKSQLGRPCKRSSEKKTDAGAITSPVDPDKSLKVVIRDKVSKSQSKGNRISSRFSIISFKPFKSKSLSADKSKTNKIYDKRKSELPAGRRISKSKDRHRSPEKKKKPSTEGHEKVQTRSPNKKMILDEDERKLQVKSSSPSKVPKPTSLEKRKKHRAKSPERSRKFSEGSWLIKKFLADEEMIGKPPINISPAGSLGGSLSSINGTPFTSTASVSPSNGSPIISHNRNGSTRALLSSINYGSPIRGFINEAFIASPRNTRAHSSLRALKSFSPENEACYLRPTKYRRSVSMGAYNSQIASPDKRKRVIPDDGIVGKRRRVSSPEKSISVKMDQPEVQPAKLSKVSPPLGLSALSKAKHRRNTGSSLPSSVNSSYNSLVAVPEKVSEKLSLITASPSDSMISILVPNDEEDQQVSLASFGDPAKTPKDWV